MIVKNGDLPSMPIELNGFGLYEPAAYMGLTKREMFAMAAMQGLLSGVHGDSSLYGSAPEWVRNVSEASVEFADALLAELERT